MIVSKMKPSLLHWRWWRWILRLLVFGCCWLTTTISSILTLLYLIYVPLVPLFAQNDDYQPKLGTRIFSADNQLIGEFALERRVLFVPEKLPPLLAGAFMAAEDKRFYQHHGIDYIGMIQAGFDKLRHPTGKLRGASTITQQVAKSLLATHESYESATERSLSRKVREAILAYQLEKRLSKQQILTMYLNQTYLGNKAYGVGAAAEHYFHKSVEELTLAEMALLAGLPQRPSDYSPLHRPHAALARRGYVLKRMLKDGYITSNQYTQAVQEKLHVYPRDELYLQMAPFFTEQVRRELVEHYGEHMVLEEGLSVYTTVNLQFQNLAERTVAHGLEELDKRQGYRGPIAHLSLEQRHRLLIGQRQFSSEQGNDGIEIAIVTGFSGDGRRAYIDVKGESGVIPLPLMDWARFPNPLERFGMMKLQDVRTVLTLGDAVAVIRAKWQQLAQTLALKFKNRISETQKQELQSLRNMRLFSLAQTPLVQGALVVVDPHSAEVRALVGGYDFQDSSYNRATQACREPGSLFKPIVYASAIDKLNYTASTLIDDKPLVFNDFNNQTRWKPSNATSQFRGRVPLRTCLKDSINTAAIRVAEAVGMEDIIRNARKLGMTVPLKRELGTALGSSCTTLWELMQVYTTLNQYGRRRPLHLIRRVVDRFGNVLEDHTSVGDPTADTFLRAQALYRELHFPPPQVFDERSAFLTVSLLKDVITSGTAMRALKLKQIIAGKTGTTNDAFDAWFLGFTRNILAGVWIGHDKNERPLGPGEQGGRTALPLWIDFMQNALLDYRPSYHQDTVNHELKMVIEGDFPTPEGVVEVAIDPETGLLARTDSRSGSVLEYYRTGTEPTELTPDRNIVNPQEVDLYKADQEL